MAVRSSAAAAVVALGLLAPLVARGAESDTYRATDSPAAGESGSAATFTIAVAAPSITSGPPTLTNQTSASFEFTGEPDVTFSCKLEVGDFATCTSPANYTGLSDGAHTFAVRATDAASTVSEASTHNWTVDTVAPNTTVSSSPPPATSSTSATFSFSSTEAGSSFSCSLDGAAFATCPSPPTYAGLAEGTHTFRVQATDAANNTDQSPALFTWTVDTTAPVAPTITSGPPTLTNQTSASFAFSHSEPGVTFSCKLDGGGFATCRTYTGLSNGAHTFAVRATDAAGNIGAASTYNWTVDTARPNTTITSHPPLVTSNTSATFRFSSTKAQSTFECRLDSRPPSRDAAHREPTTASLRAHTPSECGRPTRRATQTSRPPRLPGGWTQRRRPRR